MKTFILGLGATIGALVFPAPILLVFMALMILIDFVTGYAAAVAQQQNRTSSGLRKTITKLIQYGSVIVISMVVVNSANYSDQEWVKLILPKLNNALVVYIIYIEIYSVLENLLVLSPNSAFTQFLVKPLYQLFSINLKALFDKKTRP
jgi:phosphatidylglycerophosphate synthase